ncbi:hypothetical protein D5R40_32085 [Okeania hirsuta]|uniref:Uncharacterized protein n=1 Tax=Okeania hirsuta TaxID=1458930 RepID=A0A3N6NUG0_9CYAN|nr:hypothetical protein D5R40_32085 [Okeania hirsuta]
MIFSNSFGEALPVLSAGFRVFDGIDIQVVAAGEEFLELTKLDKPTWGLPVPMKYLSIRICQRTGYLFLRKLQRCGRPVACPVSIDSLQNGVFTRDLGIPIRIFLPFCHSISAISKVLSGHFGQLGRFVIQNSEFELAYHLL